MFRFINRLRKSGYHSYFKKNVPLLVFAVVLGLFTSIAVGVVIRVHNQGQNFRWGVLALNTNKSVYRLGDEATVMMAVLDHYGRMQCDANLTLTIKGPDGKTDHKKTSDSQIKVHDECFVHDKVTKPDFSTQFKPWVEGKYTLTLKAKTKNGTKTVKTAFYVQNDAAFDIERISNTRIYPAKTVPVALHITAYQDFSGIIEEEVPQSFEILPNSDNKAALYVSETDTTTNTITKRLRWRVSLKRGDKAVLGYEYNAPDTSPYYYEIGPLRMVSQDNEIFAEKRSWQIASDPNPAIEQQININSSPVVSGSTAYARRDFGAGAVRWDGTKYSNESVYFDAVIKTAAASITGSVALFDSSGNKVTGSNMSTTSTSYNLNRSSALTLTDNTDYSVRVKCKSTTTADCWEGPQTIDTGDVNNMVTGLTTPDGVTHIIYSDGSGGSGPSSQIKHAWYVGSGGNCSSTAWSCEVLDDISTDNTGSELSATVDSAGTIHIAYKNATTGALYYAKNVAGTGCTSSNWTCERIDDPTDAVMARPSIAVDTSNVPHIAYVTDPGTSRTLKYASRDTGNTGCTTGTTTNWTCETIKVANDYGWNPSLAIGTDNIAQIAAHNGGGSQSLMYARRSAGTGCDSTSWTCETVDDPADAAGDTAFITVDKNNTAHISYFTQTSWDLYYAVRTAGSGCTNGSGNWTCTLVDSAPTVYYDSAIVLDDEGNPHIAYEDYNNALRYASYVGSGGNCASAAWDCYALDTIAGTGGARNMNSIIYDKTTGSMQIPYRDATNADLRFIKTKSTAVSVTNAKLVVVQSNSAGITATQGQISMASNENTTTTSYTDVSNPKIYNYDSSKFNPAPTAYFESTIKGMDASSTTSSISQGPTSVTSSTTCVNDTTNNLNTWTNPNNAALNDNVNYATSAVDGTISSYLKCTGFGFSVPSGAIITGITVGVDRKASNTGITDSEVKVVKGGVIGATNKAAAGAWPTADAIQSYGSSTDLWGLTWTNTDINSANFGVVIAATKASAAGAAQTASVDDMQITVSYATTTTTPQSTAYAALYTKAGVYVTGSEVSVTGGTWARMRSPQITLSNATEYVVRIKTSAASTTAYIATAKIILDQSSAGGLTDVQLVHDYLATPATQNTNIYMPQQNYNTYTPANFSATSVAYLFEATMKTSAGTGYVKLKDTTANDEIDTPTTSELTTISTAYERKTSSNLASNIDWPSLQHSLDTIIRNGATDTTSVSSAQLVINVGGLFIGPSKVAFTTAQRTVTAGTCSGVGNIITLQLQDGANVARTPSGSTTIRLTSTSPDYAVYSDDTCLTQLTNGDITFSTTENTKSVYIIDRRKSNPTFTLTAAKQAGPDTIASGNQTITVNAGAVSRLVLTLPGQTFTDGTGNSGSVTTQTAGAEFTLVNISATDAYNNINTGYIGNKTLIFSGANNAPDTTGPTVRVTTGVNFGSNLAGVPFASGQLDAVTVKITLYKAEAVLLEATELSQTYGYAASSLTVNPGSISANTNDSSVTGSSSVVKNAATTYTITLKDTWRNPKSGVPAADMQLSTSGGTYTQPASPTDANGQATGQITFTTVGNKTVRVLISNSTLVQDNGSTLDADGYLDNTQAVSVQGVAGEVVVKGGTKIRSGTFR